MNELSAMARWLELLARHHGGRTDWDEGYRQGLLMAVNQLRGAFEKDVDALCDEMEAEWFPWDAELRERMRKAGV